MSFVFELIFQLVFECVAYGVGRAFLLLLAPGYGSELEVSRPPKRTWKWRGWTFEQNGRRYFYAEGVQLVGLTVIIVLTVLVVSLRSQGG
jgi:hypothetical protein